MYTFALIKHFNCAMLFSFLLLAILIGISVHAVPIPCSHENEVQTPDPKPIGTLHPRHAHHPKEYYYPPVRTARTPTKRSVQLNRDASDPKTTGTVHRRYAQHPKEYNYPAVRNVHTLTKRSAQLNRDASDSKTTGRLHRRYPQHPKEYNYPAFRKVHTPKNRSAPQNRGGSDQGRNGPGYRGSESFRFRGSNFNYTMNGAPTGEPGGWNPNRDRSHFPGRYNQTRMIEAYRSGNFSRFPGHRFNHTGPADSHRSGNFSWFPGNRFNDTGSSDSYRSGNFSSHDFNHTRPSDSHRNGNFSGHHFHHTINYDPSSDAPKEPQGGLKRRDEDGFDLDYTPPEIPTADSSVSQDPVEISAPDTTLDPNSPPTPETPPVSDIPNSSNSEIGTVLPDALAFPNTGSTPTYTLSRVLYGTGILYYKCKSDNNDASWMYSSTQVGLYNDNGYTIRIGQVSCNSISGSNPSPGTCTWSLDNNEGSITARTVKSVPAPNALDADWTRSDLLTAEGLGNVRAVFTVATVGGKPPQMIPCDGNNAGESIMVDFNAEYQFYSPM